MHLVKPVDEVDAGLAPRPVAPLVIEVVLVPFVAAFEVFKKRCLADRNLFTSEADKPFETVEDFIHRFPHPRWPGLTSPEVVVLHPYCLTSALIKRRSIFVITPSGHGQPVAAQRVSVVDTVTPSIYGVFLDSICLLTAQERHP